PAMPSLAAAVAFPVNGSSLRSGDADRCRGFRLLDRACVQAASRFPGQARAASRALAAVPRPAQEGPMKPAAARTPGSSPHPPVLPGHRPVSGLPAKSSRSALLVCFRSSAVAKLRAAAGDLLAEEDRARARGDHPRQAVPPFGAVSPASGWLRGLAANQPRAANGEARLSPVLKDAPRRYYRRPRRDGGLHRRRSAKAGCL